MSDKRFMHIVLPIIILCLLGLSCSKENEEPVGSKDSFSFKTYTHPKLGLSIRIPDNWHVYTALSADGDRFAVGEERKGGAAIIFTRESSGSISKKYPNIPRLSASLMFVRTDAMENKLIKIDKIPIAGNEWYFAVKEVENQPTVKIMRVFFWNESNTFSVSAGAPSELFEAREPIFKEILESISFAEKFGAPQLQESARQQPPMLLHATEPKGIAKIYIESWIKRDFTRMWHSCSPKPFYISEKILGRSMKTFLIPVSKGKILEIKKDKNNPEYMLVDYSMEGPTWGCILCILRGAQPSDYSAYLQKVKRVSTWQGTLTIAKVGEEWKVIEDSNPLIRTIYHVHAMSLLDPSNIWYHIVIAESMKKNMEVEELMDKYHPEMVSCCKELRKELNK